MNVHLEVLVLVEITLSNGLFFFLGVTASAIFGILGNEYVTLKYIDADMSDKVKIAKARDNSWKMFISLAFLYFLGAIVVFVVDSFF